MSFTVIFFSCNRVGQSKSESLFSGKVNHKNDKRPKSQLLLMKKIKAYSIDYEILTNSAKPDQASEQFKKFTLDSLKDVKDWVMIVDGIDDNEFASSPLSRYTFADQPIYNLKLISIIDQSAVNTDTISIDNKVNFILTLPKKPKGDNFKKYVEVIKTLNQGDTIFFSGAITKIDNEMKVNLTDVVKQYMLTNLDLLPKSIRKK